MVAGEHLTCKEVRKRQEASPNGVEPCARSFPVHFSAAGGIPLLAQQVLLLLGGLSASEGGSPARSEACSVEVISGVVA